MNDERRHKGAAERARWLAEVAETLEAARRLLDQLPASPSANREMLVLAAHLAVAIAEVQALRRGGFWQVGGNFDPLRIGNPLDRPNTGL